MGARRGLPLIATLAIQLAPVAGMAQARPDARPVHVLWVHHAPLLVDGDRDRLRLPWARELVTRDGYFATALLREHPDLRVSSAVTSSLLVALRDYTLAPLLPHLDRERNRIDARAYLTTTGRRPDPWIDIALKPDGDLDPRDRRLIAGAPWDCFSVPPDVLDRFPQYRALSQRDPRTLDAADRTAATCWFLLSAFSTEFLERRVQVATGAIVDLTDLVASRSPGVWSLRRRWTPDDANRLVAEIVKVVEAFLSAHRTLAAGGRIELVATPAGDPLLPLLDGASLRDAVRAGLDLHETTFGVRPRALLAPGGHVDREALPVLRDGGVTSVWIGAAGGQPGTVRTGSGTAFLLPASRLPADIDAAFDALRRLSTAESRRPAALIVDVATLRGESYPRRLHAELDRLRRSGKIAPAHAPQPGAPVDAIDLDRLGRRAIETRFGPATSNPAWHTASADWIELLAPSGRDTPELTRRLGDQKRRLERLRRWLPTTANVRSRPSTTGL